MYRAVLNYQNAREYLAYFCATISCAYINNQPDFVMHRDPITDLITAKVVLPSYLSPSLRTAWAKSRWLTEKLAKRDAAFQAYMALYNAGLVNDNLMPVHRRKYNDEEKTMQEKQARLVQVSESWNPWLDMAHLHRSDVALIATRVCFESNSLGVPDMVLLLPKRLPCDWEFDLFWNAETTLKARLCYNGHAISVGDTQQAARFTHEMLYSVYHGRMLWNDNDYLTLFWPAQMVQSPIEQWLLSIKGTDPAQDAISAFDKGKLNELGIARSTEAYVRAFTVEQTINKVALNQKGNENGEEDNATREPELHIQGTNFPKRADFLHALSQDALAPMAHTSQQCVPVRLCNIHRIPVKFSKFALFVPSIAHKIEILYVAERLARTVLSRVKFKNLGHVLVAISASEAREPIDYQRYEFLGDSLLKFIVSIHLTATNPLWHEGLLSIEKDKIVSNDRLAQAARREGLDQYILTKPFTGRKWKPYRVSDFGETGQAPDKKRELSTKVLADVVEALMGASYLDGGIEKMSTCARVLLPGVEWTSVQEEIHVLYRDAAVSDVAATHPKLAQIEEMLGYNFTKPSLVFEALTHPCCQDASVSYQRLEFLGDSVLDHIVVQELFHLPKELSHQDMHLMRTTVANADFLAFLCLRLHTTEEREEAISPGLAHVSTIQTEHKTYLWQMMRHGASWEIVNAQQEAFQRYQSWGGAVEDALKHSSTYPWTGLFRISPGKFFSDMVESLLGAIFVDSHGSLDACRGFLERIGLLTYLRRVAHEDIELLHPRNQLLIAAKSAPVTIESKAEKISDGEENTGESNDNDNKLVYICKIHVDGKEIVELNDGINKLEVETRAAALAAKILKRRSSERMDESKDGEASVAA
jgi:dsRNA-specific ribonuclease